MLGSSVRRVRLSGQSWQLTWPSIWLVSFLTCHCPWGPSARLNSNPTPAEARFDSIELESPRRGTHTCTSSCQLAHCNRRLTRINYSSLTCDIHTAAHMHTRTHTRSTLESSALGHLSWSHIDSRDLSCLRGSLIDISFSY